MTWYKGSGNISLGSLSSVVIANNTLYWPTIRGVLQALDPKTGKLLWKYDSFAQIWASPLVADDKIFIGDEDGELAIFEAAKFNKNSTDNKPNLLKEIELNDAIYGSATAKGSVLYVASRTKLYALEVKQ